MARLYTKLHRTFSGWAQLNFVMTTNLRRILQCLLILKPRLDSNTPLLISGPSLFSICSAHSVIVKDWCSFFEVNSPRDSTQIMNFGRENIVPLHPDDIAANPMYLAYCSQVFNDLPQSLQQTLFQMALDPRQNRMGHSRRKIFAAVLGAGMEIRLERMVLRALKKSELSQNQLTILENLFPYLSLAGKSQMLHHILVAGVPPNTDLEPKVFDFLGSHFDAMPEGDRAKLADCYQDRPPLFYESVISTLCHIAPYMSLESRDKALEAFENGQEMNALQVYQVRHHLSQNEKFNEPDFQKDILEHIAKAPLGRNRERLLPLLRLPRDVESRIRLMRFLVDGIGTAGNNGQRYLRPLKSIGRIMQITGLQDSQKMEVTWVQLFHVLNGRLTDTNVSQWKVVEQAARLCLSQIPLKAWPAVLTHN